MAAFLRKIGLTVKNFIVTTWARFNPHTYASTIPTNMSALNTGIIYITTATNVWGRKIRDGIKDVVKKARDSLAEAIHAMKDPKKLTGALVEECKKHAIALKGWCIKNPRLTILIIASLIIAIALGAAMPAILGPVAGMCKYSPCLFTHFRIPEHADRFM